MKKLASILFCVLSSQVLGWGSLHEQTTFDYVNFQQDILREILGTYSEPTTSFFGVFDQSKEVVCSRYDHIVCSFQSNSRQGGALSAKSIEITDTLDDVIFVGNQSWRGGGALYTEEACSISKNKGVYFVNNNATYTSAGGAIYSKTKCSINANQRPVCFGYNTSGILGGAIYSENACELVGNYSPILFLYNQSLANYGGAICSVMTLDITGNNNPVYFVGNKSMGYGGALSSRNINIISNKGGILFSENTGCFSSSAVGGAISTYARNASIYDGTIAIEDNGDVWFDSNISKGNGGAIHALGKLIVSGNSRVRFTNNCGGYVSGMGGAIYYHSDNESHPEFLKFLANKGDILFDKNYIGNKTARYRNSITIRTSASSSGSREVVLSAVGCHLIKFYDPLVCSDVTQFAFKVNETPDCNGTVLFSGATVPSSLTDPANFTTQIKGASCTLYNGYLAIEDGAIFETNFLTNAPDGNGIMRLGQNGTLKYVLPSGTASASAISLTRLALNLPSLLKDGSKPAVITTTDQTADVITISNDGLILLDSENRSPYDSIDLSQGLTKIPLLELVDTNSSQINIKDLDLEAVNRISHYGHQGRWTFSCEKKEENDTSGALSKTYRVLYANWAPIGYVPNPKFQANLVANALWESFYIADSNLHEYSAFSRHLGVYGGAKGLIHYQYDRSGVPGFHLKTTGYSVGTYASANQDHRFSLNFGQYFSQMKEQGRSNELSSKNYSVGFKAHSHWFNHLISTTVSGVYSYGKHVVDYKYRDEDKASTGDFYSNTYGVSARIDLPVTRVARETTVAPFVEMLGVRSTLSSFTEEGDYARAFSVEHPLYEVESPVGVRGKFYTYKGLSSDWEAELAYRPTLYRQRPVIETKLLASNGTWSTKGSPTAHQAISYRLSHKANLSRHLLMMLNYQGVVSTTTFCNYLQAGMQAQF